MCGEVFPAGECKDRTSLLHTIDSMPDVILIYMGINDFYATENADIKTFELSYQNMITQIKNQYPKADIICGALMRSFIKEDEKTTPSSICNGSNSLADYNWVIRKVCKKQKGYLRIEMLHLARKNESKSNK